MFRERYHNRKMELTRVRVARRHHARLVPRGFGRKALALLAAGSMLWAAAPAWAVNLAAPPSLKTIPIPEPNSWNSMLFVDRIALPIRSFHMGAPLSMRPVAR